MYAELLYYIKTYFYPEIPRLFLPRDIPAEIDFPSLIKINVPGWLAGLKCSAPTPRCDMDLFLTVPPCFGVETQHMVTVVVVVAVVVVVVVWRVWSVYGGREE